MRPTIIWCVLTVCLALPAVGGDAEEELVILLKYKPLGSFYVSAVTRDGVVMLPVSELMTLFGVFHTVHSDKRITGTYMDSRTPFTIDVRGGAIVVGEKRVPVARGQYALLPYDQFLSVELWWEAFAIDFQVNMNGLYAELTTAKAFPAVEKKRYALKRSEIQTRSYVPEYFALYRDRERRMFDAGMLDYQLLMARNNDASSLSYSLRGGAEVIGGDIQSSINGVRNASGHSYRFGETRWRYIIQDGRTVSAVTAGQLTTLSPLPRSIIGMALTNEPVQPRTIFDDYVVEGTAEPEADVELYVNDRLTDFVKADKTGYYRFQFPLTYGTMTVSTRVYSRFGDVMVDERRIQVPFTFLPQGEFHYHVQAGRDESDGADPRTIAANSDVLYGITNWLTLKAGVQRIFNGPDAPHTLYSTISTRLFSQYLLSIDLVPGSFIRGNANVIFSSGTSGGVNYTRYDRSSSAPGVTLSDNVNATVSMPLAMLYRGTGVRFSADLLNYTSRKNLNIRGELYSRIALFNMRLSITEMMRQDEGMARLQSTGQTMATSTVSFVTPRARLLPEFLRGINMISTTDYNIAERSVARTSLQMNQTLFRSLRLNAGVSHVRALQTTAYQVGLTLDLDAVRSSTNIRTAGDVSSSSQSLLGSVAFDHELTLPFFSNREQVGLAGVAAVMFADQNINGVLDAEDEIIPNDAVRINGGSKPVMGSDGIPRILQLQSYHRYNLEVIPTSLPDPSLVPRLQRFSFITDPNQIKRIEIPLYRTGSVDGKVLTAGADSGTGMSGIRMILENKDAGYSQSLRTFGDGTFFGMSIPPGPFSITVDSAQLAMLDLQQRGGAYTSTIRSQTDGDIIEGIEIVLEPAAVEIPPDLLTEYEKRERAKASFKLRRVLKLFSQAQAYLYAREHRKALAAVDASIELYPTASAYALRGSIYYILGDIEQADRAWDMANRLDPRFRHDDLINTPK